MYPLICCAKEIRFHYEYYELIEPSSSRTIGLVVRISESHHKTGMRIPLYCDILHLVFHLPYILSDVNQQLHGVRIGAFTFHITSR